MTATSQSSPRLIAGRLPSRVCAAACALAFASGCGTPLPADAEGGGGGGGGGGGPAATDCATLMANWVHRETTRFYYFMPNANWVPVESSASLKVSGPVGEAVVVFSYFYSYTAPATVDAMESVVWQYDVSGVQVLGRTDLTQTNIGLSRTTEFTGTWRETGRAVHGILTVYVDASGYQPVDQVYLIMANVDRWAELAPSLRCLRDNIRYQGYSPNAPG